MKFKKHIFICTNERDNGKKSCGLTHGMALVDAFKSKILEHKLQIDIRAQKAGCIDVCELGPAMVVYPEGVYYGNVQLSDVEEIFVQHLLNNTPVERLRLHFNKKI